MIDIGYLCSRGHYCFHADPEENGECGSKSLGRLVFVPEPGLTDEEAMETIGEASQHLGEVFQAWRDSE